jgi:hypothetical protein
MLSKDHFTYTGRQPWQWNQDNIAIVLYIKAAEDFYCLVYSAYHEWGEAGRKYFDDVTFFLAGNWQVSQRL